MFWNANMFYKLKQIKVYEIVFCRTPLWKDLIHVEKGEKNLWMEKYFYFALSNIYMFIKENNVS